MEQRRFLLAMILSGLVIFVWQIFFVPPIEEEPIREELDEITAEEEVELDEADLDEAPAEELDEEVAEPEELEQLDDEVIDDAPQIEVRTDVIRTGQVDVALSNRGAVVTDVQVTAPRQYAGVGGDLMRAFEEDAPDWPFSLTFESGNIDIEPNALFEVIEEKSTRAADGESYKTLFYRYTDPRGHFTVDKVYSADSERRYGLVLDVEVHNQLDDNGVRLAATPQLHVMGRDDPEKESSFFDFRPDVLEGVCHTTDGTERTVFDNLENSETYADYSVLWAGADTRYFIMAAAPIDPAASCTFDSAGEDYLRVTIEHDPFSIEPGDGWTMRHHLYMGPKDFDVLRAFDAPAQTQFELQESVDYGLFTVLARPLRWSLVRLYNFTLNWGLAIILLTFIIKAITWPITGKAYTSAERMKQIQPLIKEIREKYENDQQRMTEETMKAFRENNVSPLGCLPLLLQMPILYGLFVMIYNSVELYQAEFLWYADLSAPDPYFILPVVMGAVMFIQQRITMSTAATTNPQMMIVMKVMPVAFTAFMLFLPAGLVLYYLLNLVMGLGQQFLIKRKFRLAEEAGESA